MVLEGTQGGASGAGSTGGTEGGSAVVSGATAGDSASATGQGGVETPDGQAANLGAPGGPPSYAPNYKFKVLKEEKEFPDWAKGFIKDADLEKNFRETFEKAGGLDIVKEHRDRLEGENGYFRQQVMPFVQEAQSALAFRDQGDLHSFFKAVNVSEADVLKYALQRIQLREQPGALQQHDAAAQLRYENAQLKQQLEGSQTSIQQGAVQQRTFELDTHLGRPDVSQAVGEIDARLGKPGAFRAEVIRRGQAYAAAGQDVTVDQAVKEVLQLAGWNGQKSAVTTPAAAAETANGDAGTPPVVVGAQKATLPNIKGKGTSPVKRQFKSTDDLRKYRASLRG